MSIGVVSSDCMEQSTFFYLSRLVIFVYDDKDRSIRCIGQAQSRVVSIVAQLGDQEVDALMISKL